VKYPEAVSKVPFVVVMETRAAFLSSSITALYFWIASVMILVIAAPAASAQQSGGAQLRILDQAGLIRAARVVRESGNAKVSIDGSGIKGECVAANLDGLAVEQRSPVSASGECLFQRLPSGSWELQVPGGPRWRVELYE